MQGLCGTFARAGGEAKAAATQSRLVGNCPLQGSDPERYLAEGLGRLIDHRACDTPALTPRRWQLTQEQRAEAAR